MDDSRRVRLVVVVVLALQVGVPAGVLLLADPPARFGWQMFGVPSPELSAVVVEDGVESSLELGPYLARQRPEVDYLDHLPSHLCDQLEVDRVEVRRGEHVRELSCDR